MLNYDRPAVLHELMDWVGEGKSLAEFCRQPGYPRARTVIKWVESDPVVKAEFEEVREVACDVLASETLDIADLRNKSDKDDVKHRALRIKTRMDLIERWSKRYGKRVNLADADGEKLKLVRTDEEITTEIRDLVGIGLSRVIEENRVARN